MPVFYLKSILSLFMVLLILVAMFTMLEVFGRSEKRFSIEKLKKIHKANGIVYILFFLFVAYLCLDMMVRTKAEPSPRASFHSLFAFSVILLLCLKIAILRGYKQFYGKLQTIGILIALLSFGMIGTSGGYFLLVNRFGFDMNAGERVEPKKQVLGPAKIKVKTDLESIEIGKKLYESKCSACHDPYSTKKKYGPGHQGILRNPLLPASKKPAIPDNIVNQLRNPFASMPSFSELPDDDVRNIIAFLNTL